MFHGSREIDPLVIATSEAGLDMRYSSPNGAYGSGIYFADNAAYSHTYAYRCKETGYNEMLFCCVITGDSLSSHPQQYRVPPNRDDG